MDVQEFVHDCVLGERTISRKKHGDSARIYRARDGLRIIGTSRVTALIDFDANRLSDELLDLGDE
jgi:hypothetical protein